MRESILNSKEIQKINDENKDFYRELEMHTGVPISNPDDVFDIYGTLEAEKVPRLFF